MRFPNPTATFPRSSSRCLGGLGAKKWVKFPPKLRLGFKGKEEKALLDGKGAGCNPGASGRGLLGNRSALPVGDTNPQHL